MLGLFVGRQDGEGVVEVPCASLAAGLRNGRPQGKEAAFADFALHENIAAVFSRMIFRLTASPKPVLRAPFVLTNGRNRSASLSAGMPVPLSRFPPASAAISLLAVRAMCR